MTPKENTINWFEIPAKDLKRATTFYEKILGIELKQEEMMGLKRASFPFENMSGKFSGALVQGPNYNPNTDGIKIYLNGNPDLSNALGKIEEAGGKITMPKTKISDEYGCMAFFTDTEGNTMALHSVK